MRVFVAVCLTVSPPRPTTPDRDERLGDSDSAGSTLLQPLSLCVCSEPGGGVWGEGFRASGLRCLRVGFREGGHPRSPVPRGTGLPGRPQPGALQLSKSKGCDFYTVSPQLFLLVSSGI